MNIIHAQILIKPKPMLCSGLVYGVQRYFQQFFSYIVAVSFID
jgi:hypothetical protein